MLNRIKDFLGFKVFITFGIAKELWGIVTFCSILWVFMADVFNPLWRTLIAVFFILVTRIMTELFVVLFSLAELLREIRDGIYSQLDEKKSSEG